MTYVPATDRYEAMRYRRSGRSGLDLPLVSLGFWHNFGGVDPLDRSRAIVRRAFEEDLPDITSEAIFEPSDRGSARFLIKAEGVLSWEEFMGKAQQPFRHLFLLDRRQEIGKPAVQRPDYRSVQMFFG